MDRAVSVSARYTRGAIALHWIIAALILANFILVWTADKLPESQEQQLMGFHMANGLLILILSVVRIVWRMLHPAPPFESSVTGWEAGLARITHSLFYILMIGVPLAGWAMVSAFTGGIGIDFFSLFEFPGLPFQKSEAVSGVFHETHELAAILMLALFVLHVAGALKHHVLDRNGTLARMIPWLGR